MSLILEALKKAERQHKLGKVPGISAQLSEPQSEGSKSLRWGMLSLLGLAILGIGLYLGSIQRASDQMPSQPEAQSQQPKAESQLEAQTRPLIEPSRPPGELTARPARPGQIATAAKAQPQAVRSPAQILPGDPIAPANQTAKQSVQPPPQPRVASSTAPQPITSKPKPASPRARQLNEMPSGFVSNLPEMNIDIHSYDPRPQKRYVLINMEKYREGDYLADGPLLIEILTDGVIMEHMGERFIMPLGNP
ncbi:MAG: general secretion pathway protein GspB [Candidatus Thiodiazotropha sp.]